MTCGTANCKRTIISGSRQCLVMQATSSRHTKEKDLRLEHLSWRIWFMKRKKAAALLEKQKATGLPDDTKDHLLDDTSDDDVPTPRAVKAELAKSISKELGKSMLPTSIAADLPRLPQKLRVSTVIPKEKEKESSKQWYKTLRLHLAGAWFPAVFGLRWCCPHCAEAFFLRV